MADLDLFRLRLQKLAWVLREPSRISLLRHAAAPSLEHLSLLRDRTFPSVIDVGANVGQFALFAMHALGAKRIVCVEPQPNALDHLVPIARTKGVDLRVLSVALGNRAQNGELHVTAAADSASLLTPERQAIKANPGLKVATSLRVPIVRGDDVMPPDLMGPTLLKIDVQGMELPVLEGLGQTLATVQSILVEVSFAPIYQCQTPPQVIVDVLSSHGFCLTGVSGVPGASTRRRIDQADLLWDRGQ